MQDIEAIASRVLLIGKGEILLDGTVGDLKRGDKNIDEVLVELYKELEI
jgi:ABC-2 type transport system ATP-binding protein